MMKRIAISTLFLGLIVACQQEPTKPRTPEIRNPEPVVEENEHQPEPNEGYANIVASQSGRLEWVATQSTVKKGHSLYRIKNAAAFKDLYRFKMTFKKRLDSLITTCPDALNPIRGKWENFYADFRLDSLTPIFPQLQFKEEADHFGKDEFVNDYNQIVIYERGMKKYFIQASTNLQDIEWFKKSGERIEKGEVIGQYSIRNLEF